MSQEQKIKVTAVIEGDATPDQVMHVTDAMKNLGKRDKSIEWHVKGTLKIS